VRGRKRKGG